MKDIDKKVKLYCSVCGNDQFTCIDEKVEDLLAAPDDIEIKCSDCGRIVTKVQLIEENSHVIDANVEDLKKEVMKQMEKELKNILK